MGCIFAPLPNNEVIHAYSPGFAGAWYGNQAKSGQLRHAKTGKRFLKQASLLIVLARFPLQSRRFAQSDGEYPYRDGLCTTTGTLRHDGHLV